MKIGDLIFEKHYRGIAYHATYFDNARGILNKGEFKLSSVEGDLRPSRLKNSPDLTKLLSNGFIYYFSVGRLKSNVFTEEFDPDVIFVLNLDSLSSKKFIIKPINYYYRGKGINDLNLTLSRQRESEERVFSKVRTIDINGLVLEMHVHETALISKSELNELVETSKEKNISVYLYDDLKSFKILNKKKAKRLV